MEFAFHYYNSMADTGLMMALTRMLGELTAPPVVLCIVRYVKEPGHRQGSEIRKRLFA